MESIDLLVLRSARDWISRGDSVLLATVARTWGSSPRPVGSMMALRNDGQVVGSVSGGCIEDDLIHRYTQAYGGQGMHAKPPEVVRYGVSADEAHRFGLPCGGTVELILEYSPSLPLLSQLIGQLDAGYLVRRQLTLSDGSVELTPASAPERFGFDGIRMVNTLGPGYRALLIGAGALAEYLATMALFNGFTVSVCDPRTQYMSGWSVDGVKKIVGMPDDAVRDFAPDLRSCIVCLSHDPKLDDLALIAALESPAFYVGTIGSRRNNQSRRERLIEHFGHSETSLQRLRGPIGIYIGSKTPAEIAVSVMAEIIAAKNDVSLPDESQVAIAKGERERGLLS
jgi:xanthine dehydrogenase accessory factor